MKFTIFTDELKTGLSRVVRLLPAKASLPVLENIYMKVEDGFLLLSCTDLEIGIKERLVVKSDEGGALTIPGKLLSEYVNAVSSEKIDFSTSDDTLVVTSDKSNARFVGIDAKEYPDIPSLEGASAVALTQAMLAAVSTYVSFAASVDANRPVLTGVLFAAEEGSVSFVATDGYRLSIKTTELTNSTALQLILPTRFLVEASRLFGSTSDTGLEFLYDQGKSLVVLRNQEAELSSRLIQGEFPPYQAIVPSSFTTRAVFSKEDLLVSLRIISVFGKDTGNIVKMNIKQTGIEMTSNASQIGSSTATLAASVEGEETEIAFNIRYLTDFLGSCKSSQLIAELTGRVKPALFQEMGNDTYRHVIMPIKMQT